MTNLPASAIDSDIGNDLQTLHAQLQAMQAPLANGDLDGAQWLLSRHDQDLRQFLASPSRTGGCQAQLRALLAAQQTMLQTMTALRDRAAEQMRQLQQSGRAARSYARMGGERA
ncbi:hypothetical protein [Pseudoxanthomonas dokdonensis]|uniref:Flagellar protein FliT n=1 Tax=Pseudoxanthomonas dokdonensis TaxID=344882 RepID=A0A0R0CN25_9GAMM|nr:hypothetical protein [Pseudoxanthomonas dokdonensis]KRG71077.1 hypothetical protein ABB29_04465 [Pseudoxanthomonas dokdonensis]